MSNTHLIIDNREKDLKSVFKDAEFKNLDLGDIQINYIKDGKEELFLLIERKTMSDLIASVNDGRYREQKKRLLESGIPKERIMYLLEGSSDNIPGHFKTLFGMIINTLFRDQLKVLRFINVEETIYFIKRIVEKLNKNDTDILNLIKNTQKKGDNLNDSSKKDLIELNKDSNQDSNQESINNELENQDTNLEYLSTIKLKKKDNLTQLNCSLLQLAQIPGMSLQNAKIIIDKYESIANLIKSYYDIDNDDKRSKMLSDLEINISNGKKRKLGPVLSNRIYQYLFNIKIEQ